jgi:hypothetical protein
MRHTAEVPECPKKIGAVPTRRLNESQAPARIECQKNSL